MKKCSKFLNGALDQSTIHSNHLTMRLQVGMLGRNQYSSFTEQLEMVHEQSHLGALNEVL